MELRLNSSLGGPSEGDISFWGDIWFRDAPLSAFFPTSNFDHVHVSFFVSDLRWDVSGLHDLPDGLEEEIISLPILNRERDSMC